MWKSTQEMKLAAISHPEKGACHINYVNAEWPTSQFSDSDSNSISIPTTWLIVAQSAFSSGWDMGGGRLVFGPIKFTTRAASSRRNFRQHVAEPGQQNRNRIVVRPKKVNILRLIKVRRTSAAAAAAAADVAPGAQIV